MPEKSMPLQLGGEEVSLLLGAAIQRAELYGRQRKTVEIGGELLEKVVIDTEGHVFLPSDITHLATDGSGSLAIPPLVRTDDGAKLDLKPSSFKERRQLQPAAISDLAALKVEAVFPVRCDLQPGLYSTEFAYHGAHILKYAVLIVDEDAAFLLTGIRVDAPLQGPSDVYSFFEEEEPEDEGDGEEDDDGGLSFQMF
jgi:hypothetical protein